MSTLHPTLPGQLADTVADAVAAWPLESATVAYDSAYLSVTDDVIVAPDGEQHRRVVVRPHGAVGVLALDDEDRVLLVEQYRHPVGRRMVELPAGTLDVQGEAPELAAARELGEEADVVARQWSLLISPVASPGYSSETWHVYRATELSPVPEDDRTTRLAEEADMRQWWVPFESAVDAVLAGTIADSMTVTGLLAELARRGRG